MQCPNMGQWQAYIDEEVSRAEADAMRIHSESCSKCKAITSELMMLSTWTEEKLSPYQAQIEKNLDNEKSHLSGISAAKLSKFGGKQVMKNWKKWAGVAVAAAMLTTVLTVAPVKQAVAEFLSVFRVKQAETIKLSTQDLEQMANSIKAKAGELDLKQFGKVDVLQKPDQGQGSFEEAQTKVTFSIKQPAFSPDNQKLADVVGYSSEGKAKFQLDVSQVNKLLKSLGAPTLLPDSLQGKEFTLKIPAVAHLRYEDAEGKRGLSLTQVANPEVIVPEGVDPSQLRKALLDLPILPNDIRTQLAQVEDWQNTLLIPDVDGKAEEVAIGDAKGFYQQSNHGFAMLVWVKDGVIYQLSGKIDLETAAKVARSVK